MPIWLRLIISRRTDAVVAAYISSRLPIGELKLAERSFGCGSSTVQLVKGKVRLVEASTV